MKCGQLKAMLYQGKEMALQVVKSEMHFWHSLWTVLC